ncbi:MAG TPA: hypothetical protein VHM91_17525 [Verrucomicrobiales bacterium]|nr:hypothetical protein [Verrucomicrobiales bacterium]
MKTSPFLLPFMSLLLLSGCNREPEVIVETKDGKVVAVKDNDAGKVTVTNKGAVVVKDTALIWPAVEEAVREQVKALNKEDVDLYMSYIHRDNPGYGTTKDQVIDLFEKYDLRTTLEKIEPVTITEDEAKVSFVQLTEKISGPAFSNNRTTGTHTLRKDDGKWKIFSSEARSVTAVDPVP